jgi:hypothetical protein
VDSTHMTLEEVVARVEAIVAERLSLTPSSVPNPTA